MRIFYWILIIVASVVAYLFIAQAKLNFGPVDPGLNAKIQNSNLGICYVVGKEKWLEFSIPENRKVLRVLSTAAVLKTDVINNLGVIWSNQPLYENFTLRYQILDSANNVLMDKAYHNRTSITVYESIEQGVPEISGITYFVDQPYIPTNSVNTLIDLKEYPGTRKLRIKLEDNDAIIKEVMTRVYINEFIQPYKLKYMWQRLKEHQKITLTKGSVYPPELLDTQERKNILNNQWHPIEPSGIPGQDYIKRTLYSYNDLPGTFVKPPILPIGVLVDKDHFAMIPIPKSGGKIKLQFDLLQKGVNEANVSIIWHGRGLRYHLDEQIKITRSQPFHIEEYQGGFFLISSKEKFTVRMYLMDAKGETEITPLPMYLMAFPLNETAPLEFKIEQLADGMTPVRIDFRCLIDETVKDKKPTTIPYELLDESNTVVQNGIIAIPYETLAESNNMVQKGLVSEVFTPSQFDWFDLNNELLPVSDFVSKYFYFPRNIKKIRFLKGSEEVYITAYNRPADFAQDIKVPEDTYAFGALGLEQREERWYYIRPLGYEDYIKHNYFNQLLLQYRPPEEDPMLVAGVYDWDEFYPTGEFYSQQLVLPVIVTPVLRENALPIFLRKIPENRDVKLDILKFRAETYLTPTLVWIKDKSTPLNIKGTLDGNPYFNETLNGNNGAIRLGPLQPGKHIFNVESSEKVDFYINYTGYEPGGLQLRTAHKIDHSSLTFAYQRTTQDKETLIIYFFPPYGTLERATFKVTIIPPLPRVLGITNDWSPTSYQFDVNNADEEKGRVANVSNLFVGNGQPMFMPLSTDMPMGDYKVIVEQKSGPAGFVSLTRVIPGHSDVRKFYSTIGE